MTTTFSKRSALTLFAALALSMGATTARAQEQTTTSTRTAAPTTTTPGMIGANTVGAGTIVVGAATGFPSSQLRAIFGLGRNFDLGVFAGVTYSQAVIAGLQQGVGLDLQVPIRWTLLRMDRAAMALRVVPFFRIGQMNPAYSVGGLVGARFSIPLPKIFSLVVGPEMRFSFASWGQQVCLAGFCASPRFNAFDGAAYAVLGIEALIGGRWHVNVELDGGGYFTSDNNDFNAGGLFNAWAGFGYSLR